MPGDPFSDILWLAEAKSVLSGGLAAGGTWAFRFRSRERIKFYLVAEGVCWLRSEGERKALRLEQGDVLLLSGPRAFVIGGSPTAPPRDACPVFESGGTFARVGSRSDCVLLAGSVSLHPASSSFVASALPALVHVRAATPEAATLRWMVERIDHERRAALPGAEILSAQLAQILFIEALRAHMLVAAALPAGWLRALRDQRLVRALRLMHHEPGRDWKLDELAKAAGMSRARFALRFKESSGVAPLAYLARWRMHVAQKRLREENASIGQVAAALGYRSESAFSHAFKRITGTGPRSYREREARRATASDVTTAREHGETTH